MHRSLYSLTGIVLLLLGILVFTRGGIDIPTAGNLELGVAAPFVGGAMSGLGMLLFYLGLRKP